jgi:Clr5 domain
MSGRAAAIPDKQWHRHKADILNLYSHMTLAAVKTEMQRLHNFDATISQYKRRLAKWEHLKNLKGDEAEQLLQLPTAERCVRGHIVRDDKLRRHQRRRMRNTRLSSGSIQSLSSSDSDTASSPSRCDNGINTTMASIEFDRSQPGNNSLQAESGNVAQRVQQPQKCPAAPLITQRRCPSPQRQGFGLYLLLERVRLHNFVSILF